MYERLCSSLFGNPLVFHRDLSYPSALFSVRGPCVWASLQFALLQARCEGAHTSRAFFPQRQLYSVIEQGEHTYKAGPGFQAPGHLTTCLTWLLHVTQSKARDKVTQQTKNNKGEEVTEPHGPSARGRAVEMRPPSVRAALSMCCLLGSSSGGCLFWSKSNLGHRPSAAAPFLTWSDVKGSASWKSDSLLQKFSLFKGISSVAGLCRPPLVLLVISSERRQPGPVSAVSGLWCNALGSCITA